MKSISTVLKNAGTVNLVLAALVFTVACSKSSDDSSSGATTASVLTATPNPANVSSGQTVLITPSGGTAPYNFSLISTIGGSLSLYSGTYTVFTPGTVTGTAQLQITDSAGAFTTTTIYVTGGSSSGVLSLSPLATSVVAGGAVTFTVGGGTSPYTFTVSSGGGYFASATSTYSDVYYAPSTTQTVTVRVTDATGNYSETSVYVGGTSTTSTSSCSGTFNMNIAGTSATMQVVEDANSNVGGYIAISGSYAPISGTCSGGTINFTNLYSGSPYTGTYFVNPSTSLLVMTGTFSYGGYSYSWFATQ